MTTVGLLPHDAAAGTTAQREPRVVPYAAGIFPTVDRNSWLAGVIFLVGALLLIPPCANIAILVYARTVTRRDEFAARTALGASRGRIVMQLFVEVLVLAAGAGIAGLLLARQFSGRLAGIVMPAMGPPAVLDGLQAVVGNGPLRRGPQRACRRDRGCRAGVSRHRTMAASGFRRVGQSKLRALVWGKRGRHCWPRRSRSRWRSCHRPWRCCGESSGRRSSGQDCRSRSF